MKPTDLTLLEQLKITDREIERRLAHMNITSKEKALVQGFRSHIAGQVDHIVDQFYGKMIEIDEAARIIGDAESLTRLRNYLRQYVLDLFDGDYGTEYIQTRLRIGLVHKRIGVPPKLYILGIHLLLSLIRDIIVSGDKEDCTQCAKAMEAVEKIILFDLALVFETYIHGLLDELDKGRKELEEYARDLEEKIALRTRELEEIARLDGLTRLLNQKSFYEELKREHSRARRLGEELSLIYFDLDGFKSANDRFGHTKGDQILANVARAVEKTVRAEDIPARYGGDEFCIILPHTSLSQARITADRLIHSFDEMVKDTDVTLSIGIARTVPEMGIDAQSLVKLADKAMYQSKKKKGHAVTLADEVPFNGKAED